MMLFLLISLLVSFQSRAFRILRQSTPIGAALSPSTYPKDVPVLIRSHRNQNLQDSSGQVKLVGNSALWEQWVIREAGNGMVTIRSHRNQNLQDNSGQVGLSENAQQWEMWKITKGGHDTVTIRSHRGQNLQDNGGRVGLSENAQMWEQWRIIPMPTRRLLVLGSSVSTGEGAHYPAKGGWASLLAESIIPYRFAYENHGVGGTHVDHWQSVVRHGIGIGSRLNQFDIVFLSLSLGNEGLPNAGSKQDMLQIESHYTTGLLNIVSSLRSSILPNARLVVGGPYPNDKYNKEHLEVLNRVLAAIKTWPQVDYVVDFLAPPCHDGRGHWHPGSSRDAGHPNDLGHKQMFECIDLTAILGPFEKN